MAILVSAAILTACPAGSPEKERAAREGAERIVKVLTGSYFADLRIYPRSLDDLIPAYLTALPENPWTSQPMKQVPKKFIRGVSEGNLYYMPVLSGEAVAYDFELIVFSDRGVLQTWSAASAAGLGVAAAPEPDGEPEPDLLEDLPLVEPLKLDFGGFYRSSSPEMSVSVTNRRESFLTIVGVESGCECVTVKDYRAVIPGGESASLIVAVEPAGLKFGEFSYALLISFDGVDEPAALEVFGELLPAPATNEDAE